MTAVTPTAAMKCLLWALVMILTGPAASRAGESVILLHGLARTWRSMAVMEAALKAEGYHTVNIGYPSTDHPIEILSIKAVEDALALCPPGNRIHFVTHSLGGILVRHYLSVRTIPSLGKTVMLGPPNNGSQVVDKLKDMPGFMLINGPAGRQLGTDPAGLPGRLGPANFETGIIAGNQSINLFLSTLLPGEDDGKVTVDSTRLDGMAGHITLKTTHPFMMKNKEVIRQTLLFLKHGRFTPGPSF